MSSHFRLLGLLSEDDWNEYVEMQAFHLHGITVSGLGKFDSDEDAEKYDDVASMITQMIMSVPKHYADDAYQFLGSGSYGLTWALRSGHVLKVACDRSGRQQAFYRAAQHDAHSGDATKHTVHVIDIHDLGSGWYYVVMARLTTPRAGRESLRHVLKSVPGFETMPLDELTRATIEAWRADEKQDQSWSDERIAELVRAFDDVRKRAGGPFDLHAANYGYPSSDQTTPVYFDPIAEGRRSRRRKKHRAPKKHTYAMGLLYGDVDLDGGLGEALARLDGISKARRGDPSCGPKVAPHLKKDGQGPW